MRSAHRTRTTLTTLALAAAVTVLAGCGEARPGDASSGSGSTTSTTPDARSTTTTDGPTPSATLTVPTVTRPAKPDRTLHTPPPAREPVAIPGTPKDYAAAFVQAWLDQNKAALQALARQPAVDEVLSATPKQAPRFVRCATASGTTSCTWEGEEYTLTVRVADATASARQKQAVTGATFAH